MSIKTGKIYRQLSSKAATDSGSIFALAYSEQSGALKNLSVGYHLTPIESSPGTYTTNVTSAAPIAKGSIVAVYNNGSSLRAITFGFDSSVAALGPGATDTSGNVGYACPPNSWSYFNSYNKGWVRSNSSDLIVYLVSDDTFITALDEG